MASVWFGPARLIASNLKYEDRVTNWAYGKSPTNWYWDTMLAAHVLDCRPDITSIKFQVYVLLGVGVYNTAIDPFLRSPKNSHLNSAEHNIEIGQLCQYCGEDSLYEGLVAEKQISK
jgi:hypothetical protein